MHLEYIFMKIGLRENLYGKGELGAIEPTRGWNFDLPGGIDYRENEIAIISRELKNL